MAKPAQFFCVGHYTGAGGTSFHAPVHLDGKTMPEAQASLRWQNAGEYWPGAIYTPIAGKPGHMSIASAHRSAIGDHPAEVELSGPGGWTPEAWAAFLSRNWQEG